MSQPLENIGKMVYNAIEKEVQQIIEEEAKVAAGRVESRVRGMVGSIAAKVLSRFSMEMPHQQEMVIRVDISDLNK